MERSTPDVEMIFPFLELDAGITTHHHPPNSLSCGPQRVVEQVGVAGGGLGLGVAEQGADDGQ